MKTVDEDGHVLDDFDISEGYVMLAMDECGEMYQIFHRYPDEELSVMREEAEKLKKEAEARNGLNSTDYIMTKAMEELLDCVDIADILRVLLSFRNEYQETIDQRKEWRKTINELEES